MTIKQMKVYADIRGFYFNGERDYKGFYKVSSSNGIEIKSDTLKGLKNIIDKHTNKL